jgi:hypothetical protein
MRSPCLGNGIVPKVDAANGSNNVGKNFSGYLNEWRLINISLLLEQIKKRLFPLGI